MKNSIIIKFDKVTKTFGKITALKDISLEIEKGEFVFITGSSGAGKTTLLRIILRDLLPDKGKVFFEGKNLAKLSYKEIPKLRQQIGVVFQDFKVLPERTVRENVEVALAVIGVRQDEWQARVDRVLKLVGLLERAELFPSQISGGELQRVSLARALVVNPKVLLADEPTGNLDWDTSEELMKLFEKINQEGKTVIMATHHRLIVDKYSSTKDGKLKRSVIELKDGRLLNGVKEVKKKVKEKEEKKEE